MNRCILISNMQGPQLISWLSLLHFSKNQGFMEQRLACLLHNLRVHGSNPGQLKTDKNSAILMSPNRTKHCVYGYKNIYILSIDTVFRPIRTHQYGWIFIIFDFCSWLGLNHKFLDFGSNTLTTAPWNPEIDR